MKLANLAPLPEGYQLLPGIPQRDHCEDGVIREVVPMSQESFNALWDSKDESGAKTANNIGSPVLLAGGWKQFIIDDKICHVDHNLKGIR